MPIKKDSTHVHLTTPRDVSNDLRHQPNHLCSEASCDPPHLTAGVSHIHRPEPGIGFSMSGDAERSPQLLGFKNTAGTAKLLW